MVARPLLRVVSGHRHQGVCKYCHRAIEWATTAAGKTVPLNAGALILHVERNEETRVRFDAYAPEASHIVTCKCRPARPPRPRFDAWGRARR